MKKIAVWLIIALATALTLVATWQHAGVDPDSTVYIGAARNLVAGRGLTMPVIGGPLTHYPPLYALILSLPVRAGMDMLYFTLALNLVLLVATILMAQRLAARLGMAHAWLPAALVALCPGVLTAFWMVWSEPVFLCLTFAGLLAVDSYLARGKIALLAVAGAIFALAWLDRYIGIALIVGVCGGLWLFSARRVRDVLVFAFISAAPLLAWLALNALQYGHAIDRHIALRPLTPAEGAALVGELVLLGLLYVFLRRREAAPLAVLCILVSYAYLAALAVTVCLMDPATPVLDTRIQLPVLAIFLVLLPWLAGYLRPRTARLFSRLLVTVALIQLAAALAYTTLSYTNTLNYSDGSWTQEGTHIPAHAWR